MVGIFKGGEGSGNFGHRGRIGEVGGSQPQDSYNHRDMKVYESLSDLTSETATRGGVVGFFVTQNAKIVASPNPTWGLHEEIAHAMSESNMFKNAIKPMRLTYEMAAIESGFIRCEYDYSTKQIYIQAEPFTTNVLHTMQSVMLGKSDRIEYVVVSGWRNWNDTVNTHVGGTEMSYKDFMVADKAFVHPSSILRIKQLTGRIVTKGSSTSGNYGHSGRPGKRGGSTARNNAPVPDKLRVMASREEYIDGYILSKDKSVPLDIINKLDTVPALLFFYNNNKGTWVVASDPGIEHDMLRYEAEHPTELNDIHGYLHKDKSTGAIVFYAYDMRQDPDYSEDIMERLSIDSNTLNRSINVTVNDAKAHLPANTQLRMIAYEEAMEYAGVGVDDWSTVTKEKRLLDFIVSKERLTGHIITKGGAGSGNHGHSGRPGKVGGSASARITFTDPVNGKTKQYDLSDGERQAIQNGVDNINSIISMDPDIVMTDDGPRGHVFGHHSRIKGKNYIFVNLPAIRDYDDKKHTYTAQEWFGVSDDSQESIIEHVVVHEAGHYIWQRLSKKSTELVKLPGGSKGRVETDTTLLDWRDNIWPKYRRTMTMYAQTSGYHEEGFCDEFAKYITGENMNDNVEQWFSDNIRDVTLPFKELTGHIKNHIKHV